MADSGAMTVQLVRSTRLFPGAPYAYAARASQPDLVFTAGACPLDEQGQVAAPADVRAQMRQALENLRIAWDEVAGFFGDHDAPSTLLGVAVLGYPGQLVEIEAVAATSSRQPR